MAIFGDGAERRRLQIAIGLVDQDQVCELDDAFLEALKLVTGARGEQEEEHVHHVGDGGLGLPDPYRLDDHHIESRGFRQQDRLAAAPRHAAEGRAGGRRPDESPGIASELRHARLVAQERAAAALRRGIDREDGNLVALLDDGQAERLDERRFAHAGRAGNAESDGDLAGTRANLLQQPLRARTLIVSGRLDEGYGAGERTTVAAAHCSG